MEDESRIRLLKNIGATPVISKEYDPSCTVSYTAELARRLKKTQTDGQESEILSRLIRDADCVDKDVITEIIDLGTNYSSHYGKVEYAATASLAMLVRSQQNDLPNDTRVAFAIRTGVIEMYLGFIERFGSTEIKEYMYNSIKFIFSTVHTISLHQKTARAIRSKKTVIEERLVRLEQNSGITSNAQSEKLLDMVRSILGVSGSYCCRCNKSLRKTEALLCNGCGRMTYCSRACQRDDWLNGHSITCCRSPIIEHAGQFQGRYIPERVPSDERAAAKLKEVEINMNTIHLKLFLDHSETILVHAKDIPLYDCVVHFDLRHCPPTLNVMEYKDSFNAEYLIEGFEKSRSKDYIMCVYHSNIYIGEVEEKLAMQRFFPHEWLKKQSESAYA